MKRLRFIIVLLLVVVLGSLAINIFRAREPRYQGRTLTEWIDKAGSQAFYSWNGKSVYHGHVETNPDWQAASHAIRQMTPNAIPTLLNWVQAEDTPQKAKVIDWINEDLRFDSHIKLASDRNNMAILGFELLGDEAKRAWPILVQWTYNTNREQRCLAFACLAASYPDKETIVPVMLRLLDDPDKQVQFSAAAEFSLRFPQDAAGAGVYKKFPHLKNLPSSQFTTNHPPAK